MQTIHKLSILVAILIFITIGCKKSTTAETTNVSEKGILTSVKPDIKNNFTEVIGVYIDMKNAFVKEDTANIRNMAGGISQIFSTIDATTFTPEQLSFYNTHKDKAIAAAEEIIKEKDLEKRRVAFSALSESVFELAASFHAHQGKIYRQFCPMAFDNKGAYWLSLESEVVNPYFGNKMLNCGKVVAEF